MKIILLIFAVAAVIFLAQRAFAADFITPAKAAGRVAAGTAVLIDVREPDEWREGVVKGALLLPLSDLQGDRARWGEALKTLQSKELILYCRSGNRSGIAARLLAGEGFATVNGGGFTAWKNAGQPVATP